MLTALCAKTTTSNAARGKTESQQRRDCMSEEEKTYFGARRRANRVDLLARLFVVSIVPEKFEKTNKRISLIAEIRS
jgi:hypothetical protein